MTKETAMKILKELHDKSLYSERTALETIVPELAVGKDERIRKWLIDWLQNTEGQVLPIDRYNAALAWLEKQGSSPVKWQKNTPENKPLKNHSVLMKTVDDIAEGEWDGKYWHQYRWSTHIYDSNVLYWIELNDLDEQGKQKPTSDTRYEVKNGDSLSVNGKPFDYEHATITQKDYAPQQEQKFKVGDYIIHNEVDIICKIISVNSGSYYVENIETSCRIKLSYAEQNFHLWTIQDAKDGDVLHSPEHNLLWIYKNKEECHAAINLNYVNSISFDSDIVIPSDVCPANRVQKSILFQKTEEAGYEWNAEKKELKKIGEDDLTEFENTLADICRGWIGEELGWKQYIKDNADVLLKIAIKKFNSIQDAPFEQKPAWSEEDSKRIDYICDFIWKNRKGDTDEIYQQEQDVKWLKSLKDRIGG